MLRALSVAILLAGVSAPAYAQNSAPQPIVIADTVPVAQDIPYPGTLKLDIDATDNQQGIFKVKQTIPVAKDGPMVLQFPKWIPGKHAPRGEIEKVAGLQFYADGKRLEWKRDVLDMFAFHVDVPSGVKQIEAQFDFVSATAANQGRVVSTPDLASIQFFSLSLYPAGYFVRQIPIEAKVTLPAGWSLASGLPSQKVGSSYVFEKTNYEVLMDSPAVAGRYYREIPLTDRVTLDVFADNPQELEATPEQIKAHKELVLQTVKTMGMQPYDNYRFLLSISDELGGIGVEHHRSSENGVGLGYFTKWNDGPGRRNLLPHEFAHSWDGKYRRGADQWAPDYRTPTVGSLLWVYEGQTQFWGYVMQARSGLVDKEHTLEAYAAIMASLDNRPARSWRPLVDTTNDPVITPRAPKGWVSQQRSEDYYNEGLLIWMEVDSILRQQSRGKKSIDDFAKLFFGSGRDGDFGQVTYTFDDVVQTLNQIMPYDWQSLLDTRVNKVSDRAPLGGFERNGYRLIYNETPNKITAKSVADLSYSLGLVLGSSGIGAVIWDSPAFHAGIDLGDTIVAVNGRAFSNDRIVDAVKAAKTERQPIKLLLKSGDRYREVAIDYYGGLRYPHLEKIGSGEAGLDKLLQPK